MDTLFGELMVFVTLGVIICIIGPITLKLLFAAALGWFSVGLIGYWLRHGRYRN